jgi:hypothetical protein
MPQRGLPSGSAVGVVSGGWGLKGGVEGWTEFLKTEFLEKGV